MEKMHLTTFNYTIIFLQQEPATYTQIDKFPFNIADKNIESFLLTVTDSESLP